MDVCPDAIADANCHSLYFGCPVTVHIEVKVDRLHLHCQSLAHYQRKKQANTTEDSIVLQ